jgi:hypothetical protein
MAASKSTRGVAANDPPTPATMTRHTREATRSAVFVFHVPGGETYFGGFSMLAMV